MRKDIIVLTTEANIPGNRTRVVGYFEGSIEQVITYCLENNIRPNYSFGRHKVSVKDVSDIEPQVGVAVDQWGRLSYKALEQPKQKAERKAALDKLTAKEKQLLGIKE